MFRLEGGFARMEAGSLRGRCFAVGLQFLSNTMLNSRELPICEFENAIDDAVRTGTVDCAGSGWFG